ncbi:hypothetical protein GBAR_LOCUS11740 [Geodia barretti]|uniref:Uncharacterized protein n=1 Tax=Geodia barretti TaxID=519541 RepID=A0AA35RYF7_GEOBA|nr:hypothetical protein GBAR_LOCUS11740 [Geodia barretti]
MAATAKEQFTGRAAPELLAAMREIAREEGRDCDAVLEEAMRLYIAKWRVNRPGVRPEVMAHYRDSLERNRRLMELLAQSGG